MNIYKNKWEDALDDMAPIHPETKFGKNVRIGEGVVIEEGCEIGDNCFIGHYSILRPGVKMGNDSEIRSFCFIAGDVRIGSNVKIFQYADVGKGSLIEDRVYIGSYVILTNTNKISHGRNYMPEITPVHVCYGARIATKVTVSPGVKIGRETMVGIGSLVTKDCEPFWVYYGNPAMKIRPVPEGERL